MALWNHPEVIPKRPEFSGRVTKRAKNLGSAKRGTQNVRNALFGPLPYLRPLNSATLMSTRNRCALPDQARIDRPTVERTIISEDGDSSPVPGIACVAGYSESGNQGED